MAKLDVTACLSAVDQEKAQRFEKRFGDIYTLIEASSCSKNGFWIRAFHPVSGWHVFSDPKWWE